MTKVTDVRQQTIMTHIIIISIITLILSIGALVFAIANDATDNGVSALSIICIFASAFGIFAGVHYNKMPERLIVTDIISGGPGSRITTVIAEDGEHYSFGAEQIWYDANDEPYLKKSDENKFLGEYELHLPRRKTADITDPQQNLGTVVTDSDGRKYVIYYDEDGTPHVVDMPNAGK